MHINGRGSFSGFMDLTVARSPHAGIIKLECGHLTVSDDSQESIHVYTPVGYTVSLF